MTAMTFRKGIGALCCLLGTVLLLAGAYYVWNAPIEHRMEAVILILAGLVLHVIFWIVWPRRSSGQLP